MTNYNERLDEIIGLLNIRMPQPKTINEAKARVDMCHEAKQSITSLIKELVTEAKPGRADTQIWRENPDDAWDMAIDEFEQNLLKGLEEV